MDAFSSSTSIVAKKPGGSWRTAENFKYPSWQQPKLSARIYRAAAHVFSLLCTRMPLSRKRGWRRRKEEKRRGGGKKTYINIERNTETHRVISFDLVCTSFEVARSFTIPRLRSRDDLWIENEAVWKPRDIPSLSLSFSHDFRQKRRAKSRSESSFSRSRSRRPWYVARSMNHPPVPMEFKNLSRTRSPFLDNPSGGEILAVSTRGDGYPRECWWRFRRQTSRS